MAEKKANSREQVKEIVASIESSIQELFQSEKYFDYLRTMSRFHSYSFNNTILIHAQMPNATHVAGFNKWKDQFGRHVKKGEHGITIIAPTPFKKKVERMKLDPDTNAPMLDGDGNIITEEKTVEIPLFRPVKVFDVSQTDGKPLPTLAENLAGDVKQYEIFMEALRRSSPVPITVEQVSPGMDGYFDPIKQRIAIREGMSEVQTVCATVHEITHSKLHNREQEQLAAVAGSKDPPKPKDRNTEEVEAESVSYAVCSYYGIKTAKNSIGYIAAWSSGRDLKELKASLDTITKTVNSLISDIDRHFAEICKERGIDLTAQREQDGPDTLEKFAADVVDYMDQLYEAGLLTHKFSLDPREQTISDLTAEMQRGHYSDIRSTLENAGALTNTPTAKALLERMEKLSVQGDMVVVYKMEANPLTSGAEDRFLVQAYEMTEKKTLIPRDVVFLGDAPQCLDMISKLESGAVDAKEVREQYIREHTAPDMPDSPERFAADLYAHLSALQENGIVLLSAHQDVQAHFRECLEQGRFDGLRDILRDTAEQTGTPNTALMDRLEQLSDQWDASLEYQVQPYLPNSSVDRASIQAYSTVGGERSLYDSVFVGTIAHCNELAEKLNTGAVTAREVREMYADPWPEFVPPAAKPEPPAISEAEEQARREVEQWEADEIVSFTVTTHEVKPPHPLEKEDAKPAEYPEQSGQDEAVFLVNDAIYLHIQQTDTGIDYTIYDKLTLQNLDGGQIDTDHAAPNFMDAALTEVLSSHAITPQRIEPVSLDMVETLQDAQQMPPALLDHYPMPDHKAPSSGLQAYGYEEDDLIPVGHDTAQTMFEKDVPLYIAGSTGYFNMAFEPEELDAPGICIFAIPRDDWESSEDFRQAVAGRMDRQEEREAAFLDHGGDCFAIYQLRDGDETRDLRYMPLPGQGVDKQFYELAYTGALTGQDAGGNVSATLENLFQRFNVNHPVDYQRPSMSVSDIVALKQDGVLTCHYVDRFAFTELHGFLPQDNPLKNAEMSMEDDYNMIDGVINNGPKEGPSVAELEAQVKAGRTISLLDLANAVQREESEKRSVLAKLKSKQPEPGQPRTAPKRSAERER